MHGNLTRLILTHSLISGLADRTRDQKNVKQKDDLINQPAIQALHLSQALLQEEL